MLKPSWALARAVVLIIACTGGCVDELEDDGPAKVVSVRPVPVSRERTVQPGQSIKLALQTLDQAGAGVDGVECFFATPEPETLIFDASASAESTQRILTKEADVDNVHAHGLAVAELTALEVTAPRVVRVWAGVGSAQSVMDGAEGSALQVWEFTVHVEPPAPVDGGAP